MKKVNNRLNVCTHFAVLNLAYFGENSYICWFFRMRFLHTYLFITSSPLIITSQNNSFSANQVQRACLLKWCFVAMAFVYLVFTCISRSMHSSTSTNTISMRDDNNFGWFMHSEVSIIENCGKYYYDGVKKRWFVAHLDEGRDKAWSELRGGRRIGRRAERRDVSRGGFLIR